MGLLQWAPQDGMILHISRILIKWPICNGNHRGLTVESQPMGIKSVNYQRPGFLFYRRIPTKWSACNSLRIEILALNGEAPFSSQNLFIYILCLDKLTALSFSLALTRKRRNPNLCRFSSIKLSRNREFVAPISLSREIHFAEKLRSPAVRVSCEVSETLEIFVFCADIHHFRLNSSIRSVYVFGIFG